MLFLTKHGREAKKVEKHCALVSLSGLTLVCLKIRCLADFSPNGKKVRTDNDGGALVIGPDPR